MKIFLDIGHPAHVHYFRNFIKSFQEKGHEFLVTARDKDVSIELLNYYNIDFINRGKGENNLIGKIFYLIKTNYKLYKLAKLFNPSLFISFASPYAAQVSYAMKIPHIAFTDTEHAKLGIISFLPFSKVVITPKVYNGTLGEKHIRFNGFMEQCYLPNDDLTTDILNFNYSLSKKIVLIRLVSWNASHDIGQSGISIQNLTGLVNSFKKDAHILISCEGDFPKDFKKYQLNINPEEIHKLLKITDLFIGEGATMASECAILGTPAIYVNTLTAGTIIEQEKHGLLHHFKSSEGVIDKAKEIFYNDQIKEEYLRKNKAFLKDLTNVNKFMEWFIINYPQSFHIIKDNPDNQYPIK